MQKETVLLMVAVLGLCTARVARAQVPQPIVAAINFCQLNPISDAAGEFGGGAREENRRINVSFSYWRRDITDVGMQGEIDVTQTIELCYARVDPATLVSEFVCPWSDDPLHPDDRWLVYDRVLKDLDFPPVLENVVDVEKEDGASLIDNNGVALTFASDELLYGAPDTEGRFLYMKVTDTSNTVYAPHEWDTCSLPSLLDDSVDEFLMWGTLNTTADPWGGAGPHVCERIDSSGNRVVSCADPIAAANMYALLSIVEDWQREGLDLQNINGMMDVYAWRNSEDKYCDSTLPTRTRTAECEADPTLPECVFCPTHFGIIPSNAYGFRVGAGSAITARPVDMTTDFFTSGRSIETLVHEYFHAIQHWVGLSPSWNKEATSRGVGPMACLYGIPGAETRCVSTGKLSIPSDFDETQFFNKSRNNVFDDDYLGAIFWRYFIEQHALMPGIDEWARPNGYPASAHTANLSESLAFRRSDEGMDLFGYYLEKYLTGADRGWLALTQELFEERMGKSFEVMMLDMHTASLLKDYITTDPRWQFQWVGDFNAIDPNINIPTSPDPAIAAQPHPDPSNLNQPEIPISDYKACCGALIRPPGTVAVAPIAGCIDPSLISCPAAGVDNFTRMDSVRIVENENNLDSYFIALPANGQVSETTPVTLNDYGAAYLRILPDSGIDQVSVTLRTLTGSPNYRVFTANESGEVTPVAECMSSDGLAGFDLTQRCQLDGDGNAAFIIDLDPTGPDPVETILFVGSASGATASFVYSFADAAAGGVSLDIVSPTTAAPAIAGISAPATSRPFLLKFNVRDASFNAVTGLSESNVAIWVTEGATSNLLDPATDYDIADLSGGSYFATVTVPTGFFPAMSNTLSLTVQYLSCPGNDPADPACTVNAENTESDALQIIAANAQPVATQLVLDRSGSMVALDGAKLQALKDAAHFLTASLPDGDALGIVGFDRDAETLFPIQVLTDLNLPDAATAIEGLNGYGCTSIGDGLFEAQSNIIDYALATPGYTFNVTLMSDGRNTHQHVPARYYASDAAVLTAAENEDGALASLPNNEGCTSGADQNPNDTAPWADGNNAYLYIDASMKPVISTLALGQDADLVELGNISFETGGILTAAPGEGADAERIPIAHALMSGFRSHWNHAAGWSRIQTARTEQYDDQPDIWVEDGAKTLQVSVSTAYGGAIHNLLLIRPDGTPLAVER